MEISVIIPTYQEEKYIEATLLSLKNQNFEGKYEVIVSDSKSRDRTVEIAKKYTKKIVVCKKRGIAYGRNAGAKVAKGKILLFVDADTILLPNTLTKVSRVFKKKEVVAATCPLVPISWRINDFLVYWNYNTLVRFLFTVKKPVMPGTFIACRKGAFEKIDGFNEELKYIGEDVDFASRISKLGKIEYIDELIVLTSVRRIKSWGSLNSMIRYSMLYLHYFLTKRGVNQKKFPPIR